ncbi:MULTISPECIES: hypothetical protein [Acetobacter]|uniref:Uncharacterized protein n=1 Tax=Komagataeibacter swingsii TaxID=215220 RepID=A0A850NYE2_9PROT|nr:MULTISPECIES: hypothetical protein [Acetobacter]MCG0996259.1 hypothetical protein [Acetobacter indonesiensis]NVN37435.1 hypothetical protein [Komagataeibacter swingsii]
MTTSAYELERIENRAPQPDSVKRDTSDTPPHTYRIQESDIVFTANALVMRT